MENVVEKAFLVALEAHEGQERRGDKRPYISHPVMVAMKLKGYGFPDHVIAAALVHDVVEDCGVTFEELEEKLGKEVTDIVRVVTHDDSLSWEERKKGYAEAVRKGPDEAKAVSVADKIHNMESLKRLHETESYPVWEHFNQGKEKKLWFEEMMLEAFKENWEHPMIDEYEELVRWMRDAG